MVGRDILEEIRLFMQDQNQNTQINGQNGMVASALGGVGGTSFGGVPDSAGGGVMSGVPVEAGGFVASNVAGAGFGVAGNDTAGTGTVGGGFGVSSDTVVGRDAMAGGSSVAVGGGSVAGVADAGGAINSVINSAEAAERRQEYLTQIVGKMNNAENILVALSKNPSVDEISAAIGLTLYLDGSQRHVTAIYSGKTPAALAFLRPEATFESNTASLQDFVIALNKEKADHLRYKLDGDFVKVYITPYKTEITEKDLTFSQGDFNVDFVVAINVHSAEDLDEALAEYGRIMHDASIVDITRGEPGRLGEIEWSDPTASSVCEMVTELIFAVQGSEAELEPDVATALLTGIVAATERFSNQRTTPETLELASKLMAMGADQQLISANVVNNVIEKQAVGKSGSADNTSLEITHSEATGLKASVSESTKNTGVAAAQEANDVLKVPDVSAQNSVVVNPAAKIAQDMIEPEAVAPIPEMTGVVRPVVPEAPVASPDVMTDSGPSIMDEPKDYAQMLEQALTEATPQQPSVITSGVLGDVAGSTTLGADGTMTGVPTTGNEMVSQAPAGDGQLPGEPVAKPEAVLPPPPAPPVVGPEAMPPSLPPVQM